MSVDHDSSGSVVQSFGLAGKDTAKISKSGLLLEQVTADFDEIDKLFRVRAKKFLNVLQTLAVQADCSLSRPITFVNIQKDLMNMRKQDAEADALRASRDRKEPVSHYIQRAIDASMYPALARTFALRDGYCLGGTPATVKQEDFAEIVEQEEGARPESGDQHISNQTAAVNEGEAFKPKIVDKDISDDVSTLDDFDLDLDLCADRDNLAVCAQQYKSPIVGSVRGVYGIVRSKGKPPSVAAVAASVPSATISEQGSKADAFPALNFPQITLPISAGASGRNIMTSNGVLDARAVMSTTSANIGWSSEAFLRPEPVPVNTPTSAIQVSESNSASHPETKPPQELASNQFAMSPRLVYTQTGHASSESKSNPQSMQLSDTTKGVANVGATFAPLTDPSSSTAPGTASGEGVPGLAVNLRNVDADEAKLVSDEKLELSQDGDANIPNESVAARVSTSIVSPHRADGSVDVEMPDAPTTS